MNLAEKIRLKLQLKENSEVEYKSAAGGFPKAEFWRLFFSLGQYQWWNDCVGSEGEKS